MCRAGFLLMLPWLAAAEIRVAELSADGTSVRTPFAFSCVAVKWPGEDPVRIRVGGELRELPPDTHHHGESDAADHSSALTCFAQPATSISIEGVPRGARLFFIDPGPSPATATRPRAAGRPVIVTRAEWGAPRDNASPQYTQVTHLIVHHTGDGPLPDAAAWLRAIWAYHVNVNGWADIGYNYLISPDGGIYEGRGGGDSVVGAHFCGTNGGTMGVAVLGSYVQSEPPRAAHDSLAALLAWRAGELKLDPLGVARHASSGRQLSTISGHRDGCATECPGDRQYPLLPRLRQEVAAALDGVTRFTPGAGSLWRLGARREADWWYGDPATATYETPGRANSGTLESTRISASAGSLLIYETWHDTEPTDSFDRKLVEASIDNGPWIVIDTVDSPNRQWTTRSLPLPAGNIRVRFRFDTVDSIGNLYEGWYLHRIRIEASQP